MKRGLALLLAMALSLVTLGARAQQQQSNKIAITNLKVGQMAPDFTLLDNQWHPVKLSEYRGKKTVIVAFYVLAFTSG
jgi:peroxiredoxin